MTTKAALRTLLVVGLIPFVLLGLLVSAIKVYGLLRYDPAYFAEPLLTRYETPGVTAKALESALQTDDLQLLAELQGSRWPARFDTNPSIAWAQLWERTGRYVTYLYFDVSTDEPYLYHVEEARGRWVVSPPDLYYFVESGAYKRAFLDFLLTWWTAALLTVG